MKGILTVIVAAVPVLQRSAATEGFVITGFELAAPQTPARAGGNVPHATDAPPLKPEQPQLYGLVPPTAEVVPVPHKSAATEGFTVTCFPLAAPHTAEMGVGRVAQTADAPPFMPAQLQLKGLAPSTTEAVPLLHKLVTAEGLTAACCPLAEPHTAGTAGGAVLQEAGVPPFRPAQLQLKGLAPPTAEAVPVPHKSEATDGFTVTCFPLAAPHTAEMEGGRVAQVTDAPPLKPEQPQL